jgi:hypothetical protein
VTNGDTGTVDVYDLDGTPINTALITGLEHPQGIAVSDGYIYVASSDPLSDLGGTIGKYTTSGATVNAALLSGLPSPLHGIAVSGNDLYITQQSSAWVGKYATSGATVDATFVAFIQTVSDPVGVAVSGTDLFVTNNVPGFVGHFTTAGSTIDEEMIETGPGTFPYSQRCPALGAAVGRGAEVVAAGGAVAGAVTLTPCEEACRRHCGETRGRQPVWEPNHRPRAFPPVHVPRVTAA